jgi:diguanylate cyclase (GGDEF)-like protein/PAS domain S-box-containing protein
MSRKTSKPSQQKVACFSRKYHAKKFTAHQKITTYMEALGQMGYVIYDYETQEVQLSYGAKKIFYLSMDASTRWHKTLLNRLNKPMRALVIDLIQKAKMNQSFEMEEFITKRRNGSMIALRVLFGKISETVLVCVVQDMTDWHKRERNIEDQLKLTQDMIDAIPLPVFMKNIHGQFEICNEALTKLLGYEKDCLLGLRPCAKKENPLAGEVHALSDEALIENEGVIRYEMSLERSDRSSIQCVLSKSLLKDSEGKPVGIVGTLRDITEERKDILHINKLMDLKDAMMEITHAIMDNQSEAELFDLILDKGLTTIESADHGTILMRSHDEIFRPVAWRGFTKEAMEAFELKLEESFVWRATDGEMKKSVRINDLKPYLSEEVPDIAQSHEEATVRGSLCSPIIVEGQIIGLMNLDSSKKNAFDESDLALSEYMREQLEIALTKRKLYDRVVYLSRHDELTDVYNRRYFEEVAERILKKAKRYDISFSLVVFDLDGLKKINDTFGHQCGDKVIKRFADIMKDSVRETDVLARYGGDEFVGIFYESDVAQLEKRLLEILEQLKALPIEFDLRRIYSSFSFGIANYPEDGTTYSLLVSVADNRMYRYKKAAALID